MTQAFQPRSYLYAPGDRPELLDKALAGATDVVVADLEDGVARERRRTALANVIAALRDHPSKPLHVRIDATDEQQLTRDLPLLAEAGAPLVRLAKVRGPEDVRRALAALGRSAGELRLGCLIETAAGVEAAYAIASADPRVAAISLGEADLRTDLGVLGARDEGLLYARSRIVVAARAAGLAAPSQSVYTDVRDLDGLRRSCEDGRALGFFGRSVVHPAQIPVVHEAYAPTEAERAEARALVEAAGQMERDGSLLLDDGRLVDRATVEQARRLLELAR